jgi:hypothetical protein
MRWSPASALAASGSISNRKEGLGEAGSRGLRHAGSGPYGGPSPLGGCDQTFEDERIGECPVCDSAIPRSARQAATNCHSGVRSAQVVVELRAVVQDQELGERLTDILDRPVAERGRPSPVSREEHLVTSAGEDQER